MKLFLSALGLLLLLAWLIEMAFHRRDREIGRRRQGSTRRWWKEPDEGGDDLGDH